LEQTADLKSGISIISDQSKNTDQKAGWSSFCAGCIEEIFKHQKKCPVCSQVYGPLIGNQPPGKMTETYSHVYLFLVLDLSGLLLYITGFKRGRKAQTILILANHTRKQLRMLIYLTTKKGEKF
jgi:hypothetical protein